MNLTATTLEDVRAELARRARNKINDYYPLEGPLRRELYPKHTSYFAAGAEHRQRLFLAGNRVGKTEGVGAYEVTCHLTGKYPDWWQGKRFDRGIKAWAAGDTGKTVRDIIQAKLLGPVGSWGTGMIPGDDILGEPKRKAGLPEAVEIVYVQHQSGGYSTLIFKSYDQRREAFQGTEQDIVWLDEEPPSDIYTECLLRTMTTGGLVMLTFTPLQGLSEVVLQFLPGGQPDPESKRFVVTATWDDVPHLSQEVKDELWAEIPPYQRDARSKGIPALGSGAIYPVPESDVICDDFPIPEHWPRAYGLDVGWNRTAAVWGALDRETDTLYLYSEHYRGEAEPSVHSDAIKARGEWVCGAVDPASRGRSQADGRQLLQLYHDLGLRLSAADNAVEAGIYQVWQRLSAGRLKVFRSCQNWLTEFRLYRRDEKGKVVKDGDHLMDSTRYLCQELQLVRTKPVEEQPEQVYMDVGLRTQAVGWMS